MNLSEANKMRAQMADLRASLSALEVRLSAVEVMVKERDTEVISSPNVMVRRGPGRPRKNYGGNDG